MLNKVMTMTLINKKQAQGFSLVELLVAMVVGLIVVAGAFSLHTSTRKIQVKNEEQMDMVADARFAIETIAYDLRHAGMWGGTNKDALIDCKSTDAACVQTASNDTPPSAMANDCATGWYYNLAQPVFATNDSNPYGGTCIPTSEGYVATTDVLEVRYADSNIPTVLLANQVYVRSNFINGRVFIGGAPAPELAAYETSPLTANHELHAYAYYISNYTDVPNDGIPSLRRVALVNSPALQTQTLVSGVVDLQVLFGVDANGDQLVDRYDSPDVITTANNWVNVYSAKIWLIMRTDKQQLGINTNKDNKKINIAGNEVTLGGADDFRYFMVSTVVDMRNLKQI